MSPRDRRTTRPPTIALIGPDGSGKSTIAHAVVDRLERPARYLYMGVNLDSSEDLLPTTRFFLVAKRRGRQRPGATARNATPPDTTPRDATPPGVRHGRSGFLQSARSILRICAWIVEEFYRAVVAGRATRNGVLVVFDRHFFCDYYATEIRPRLPGEPERSLATRLHGAILGRWYPRPDLTILLDAPAAVLFGRKHEGTLESIERLRDNYHALAAVLPAFDVVDADRPLDTVVADVVSRIEVFAAGGPRRSGVGFGGDASDAASGTRQPADLNRPGEAAIASNAAGVRA